MEQQKQQEEKKQDRVNKSKVSEKIMNNLLKELIVSAMSHIPRNK